MQQMHANKLLTAANANAQSKQATPDCKRIAPSMQGMIAANCTLAGCCLLVC
jgi:hypothetical protein